MWLTGFEIFYGSFNYRNNNSLCKNICYYKFVVFLYWVYFTEIYKRSLNKIGILI